MGTGQPLKIPFILLPVILHVITIALWQTVQCPLARRDVPVQGYRGRMWIRFQQVVNDEWELTPYNEIVTYQLSHTNSCAFWVSLGMLTQTGKEGNLEFSAFHRRLKTWRWFVFRLRTWPQHTLLSALGHMLRPYCEMDGKPATFKTKLAWLFFFFF